jgi:hypothetical protein
MKDGGKRVNSGSLAHRQKEVLIDYVRVQPG